jgi:hypothetical protein
MTVSIVFGTLRYEIDVLGPQRVVLWLGGAAFPMRVATA